MTGLYDENANAERMMIVDSTGAPVSIAGSETLVAFAGEGLTVSTVAIGPTPAIYSPVGGAARSATISIETSNVRIRWSGTNPTGVAGTLLEVGGIYRIDGAANIAALKFIRDSAATADATVWIEYER